MISEVSTIFPEDLGTPQTLEESCTLKLKGSRAPPVPLVGTRTALPSFSGVKVDGADAGARLKNT